MYVCKKQSTRAYYKGSNQLLDYLVFFVCLCMCVHVRTHVLACKNEVWLSNKEASL